MTTKQSLRQVIEMRIQQMNESPKEKKDYVLYSEYERALLFIEEYGILDTKSGILYDVSNIHHLEETYDSSDEEEGWAYLLDFDSYLEVQQRMIEGDQYVFTDGGEEGNSQFYVFFNRKAKTHFINDWFTNAKLLTEKQRHDYLIYHVTIEDNLL